MTTAINALLILLALAGGSLSQSPERPLVTSEALQSLITQDDLQAGVSIAKLLSLVRVSPILIT